MTTVDAAREALLAHWFDPAKPEPYIDALIAAVRAECETAEGRLLDEALSTLRAGGLDDPLRIRAAALDEARATVEAIPDELYFEFVTASVVKDDILAAIDALREGADKV